MSFSPESFSAGFTGSCGHGSFSLIGGLGLGTTTLFTTSSTGPLAFSIGGTDIVSLSGCLEFALAYRLISRLL